MPPHIGSQLTIENERGKFRGEVLAIHVNGRVKLKLKNGDTKLLVFDEAAWKASQAERAETFAQTMAIRGGRGQRYCVLSMESGEVLYEGASASKVAMLSEPGTCYASAWSPGGALRAAQQLRERCLKNPPLTTRR